MGEYELIWSRQLKCAKLNQLNVSVDGNYIGCAGISSNVIQLIKMPIQNDIKVDLDQIINQIEIVVDLDSVSIFRFIQNKYLICCNNQKDSVILVYELNSQRLIRKYILEDICINDITVKLDDLIFITVGSDSYIRFFDIGREESTPYYEIEEQRGSQSYKINFSENQNRLVTIGLDKAIRYYKFYSQTELGHFDEYKL